MEQLSLILGAALIFVTITDVVRTTLTTRGAGFVSRGFTALMRWLFIRLQFVTGRRAIMLQAGPLAIVLLGATWVAGLWLGWLLVFLALPGSVVDGSTSLPADLVGHVYFTGYTLSSLGLGDLVPAGGLPRLLTALASLSGLVMVTLVITYAVPLTGGVVERRKLAFSISVVGETPEEIREKFTGLQDFSDWLSGLMPAIQQCTEQRMAYPVLDLFFSRSRGFSLGVQLANLCRVTSLFDETPDRVSRRRIDTLHALIGRYIELTRIDDDSFEKCLDKLIAHDGWSP